MKFKRVILLFTKRERRVEEVIRDWSNFTHSTKGLSESWRLCLNLGSHRWLKQRRRHLFNLIHFGLWLLNARVKCILKVLTHSLPMHPFSTPWKHQKTLWFSDVFFLWGVGVEKGCIGNEWVNSKIVKLFHSILLSLMGRNTFWKSLDLLYPVECCENFVPYKGYLV